jgi:hypothetical protein
VWISVYLFEWFPSSFLSQASFMFLDIFPFPESVGSSV